MSAFTRISATVLLGAWMLLGSPARAAEHSDVPDLPNFRVTQQVFDAFIRSFGSTRGSPNFRQRFDFNNDGIINAADHAVISEMRSRQQSRANASIIRIGRPGTLVTPPQQNPPTPPQNPPQQPNQGAGTPTSGGPPTLPGSTFSVSISPDFQATLTDVGNPDAPTPIIAPNNMPLWSSNGTFRRTPLPPTISVITMPNGFDVTYRFVNTTGERRSLGSLMLGGIRFGQEIQSRDFFYDGKPMTISHQNAPMYNGGGYYPQHYYSPLMVVGQEPYTIGISVQYPAVEYKHQLYMRMEVPGGIYTQGGWNWMFRCELNPNTMHFNEDGEIDPGESRTYTMSVRVFKDHPDQWMRLFKPYRDYFLQTYGGVQYERDPRPVRCITTTQTSALSDDNPYGFVSVYDTQIPDIQYRPDLYGWTNAINEWRADHINGWQRFMVWTPSGLYKNNVLLNYPTQFTSKWRDMPPVMRSLPDMRRFAESVPEFGLWWGRSGGIMREWDQPTFDRFDPDRPAHVEDRLNELRLAKDVKVTAIGMDSITEMHAWDAYVWLKRLKRDMPRTKFVIEPRWCDFIHTMGPMYLLATRSSAESGWEITQPHYLADFLNPGHEIWAMIDHYHLNERLGREATIPEMKAELQRFASMGYVPLEHWRYPLELDIRAAESWRTTVPQDLQLPAPSN